MNASGESSRSQKSKLSLQRKGKVNIGIDLCKFNETNDFRSVEKMQKFVNSSGRNLRKGKSSKKALNITDETSASKNKKEKAGEDKQVKSQGNKTAKKRTTESESSNNQDEKFLANHEHNVGDLLEENKGDNENENGDSSNGKEGDIILVIKDETEDNCGNEGESKGTCMACGENYGSQEMPSHLQHCLKARFQRGSVTENADDKKSRNEKVEEECFFCQFCQKDLSRLNSQRRTQHLNRCMDKEDEEKKLKESEKTALEHAKTAVLDCPMCGRPCKTENARKVHVKKCAQKLNVTTEQMLKLMKNQEEEHQMLIAAGVIPAAIQNKVKTKSDSNSVLTKTKKAVKEPKSQFDADLQTAMALSISESKVATVEPKKGKKKKGPGEPPLLVALSGEEKNRRLSQRVSNLLLPQEEEDDIDLTPEFVGSNVENIYRPENTRVPRLWNRCSLQEDKENVKKDLFYVESLVPPIVVSKVIPGSKVRRMSEIPGRETSFIKPKTPVKIVKQQSKLHVNDGNENASTSEDTMIASTQTVVFLAELAADLTQNASDMSQATNQDLNCSGFCAEQPLSIQSKHEPGLTVGLQKSMLSLVNNPLHSDVCIKTAHGETVFCHKVIVACRCQELLKEEKKGEIFLPEFSADSVISVMKYLYGGQVSITSSTLQEVLDLADRYKITQLLHICTELKSDSSKSPDKEQITYSKKTVESLLKQLWSDSETEEEEEISSEKDQDFTEEISEISIEKDEDLDVENSEMSTDKVEDLDKENSGTSVQKVQNLDVENDRTSTKNVQGLLTENIYTSIEKDQDFSMEHDGMKPVFSKKCNSSQLSFDNGKSASSAKTETFQDSNQINTAMEYDADFLEFSEDFEENGETKTKKGQNCVPQLIKSPPQKSKKNSLIFEDDEFEVYSNASSSSNTSPVKDGCQSSQRSNRSDGKFRNSSQTETNSIKNSQECQEDRNILDSENGNDLMESNSSNLLRLGKDIDKTARNVTEDVVNLDEGVTELDDPLLNTDDDREFSPEIPIIQSSQRSLVSDSNLYSKNNSSLMKEHGFDYQNDLSKDHKTQKEAEHESFEGSNDGLIVIDEDSGDGKICTHYVENMKVTESQNLSLNDEDCEFKKIMNESPDNDIGFNASINVSGGDLFESPSPKIQTQSNFLKGDDQIDNMGDDMACSPTKMTSPAFRKSKRKTIEMESPTTNCPSPKKLKMDDNDCDVSIIGDNFSEISKHSMDLISPAKQESPKFKAKEKKKWKFTAKTNVIKSSDLTFSTPEERDSNTTVVESHVNAVPNKHGEVCFEEKQEVTHSTVNLSSNMIGQNSEIEKTDVIDDVNLNNDLDDSGFNLTQATYRKSGIGTESEVSEEHDGIDDDDINLIDDADSDQCRKDSISSEPYNTSVSMVTNHSRKESAMTEPYDMSISMVTDQDVWDDFDDCGGAGGFDGGIVSCKTPARSQHYQQLKPAEESFSTENQTEKNLNEDNQLSTENESFENLTFCEEPCFIVENIQRMSASNSSKNTFKTPVMNKEDRQKLKKDWAEPSPFTPMPNYDAMATPVIKKKVQNYGVKPVGKKRMIKLLKDIYHQTHQYETDSEYEDDVENNDKKSVDEKDEGHDINESDDDDDDLDDGIDNSQTSQDSDLMEETFFQGTEEDTEPIKPGELSLEDKLMEFLKTQTDIQIRILMYEPLELDILKQKITDAGIKCSVQKLQEFLDNKCITFTMKNMRKSPRKKKRRSPKKAKSKDQGSPSKSQTSPNKVKNNPGKGRGRGKKKLIPS